MNQNNNLTHWILGGSLFLVFVLVIALIYTYSSKGDSVNVNTSANINNTDPTVDSVFISAAANGLVDTYFDGTINDLVPNDVRTIHVNGVVGDLNGESDISNVAAVFYRTDVGSSCSADENDCYTVATCTLTPGTATTKKYDCSMNLQYYIDSTSSGGTASTTNWTVKVTVTDVSSVNVSDSSVNKEMETLLALNIPGSIDYGSLGLNTTSASPQTLVITQHGNDEADVEVNGAFTTCSSISDRVADIEQSFASSTGNFAAGIQLTATPTDTNLEVGYRISDVVTKTLYWNASIPTSGVLGSCTGVTTVSAIAH